MSRQRELMIATPRKLLPIIDRPWRYIGIYGGRGSGKSHALAEYIIESMVINPARRWVCVREVQKSLKESAYRLLCDKIRKLAVDDLFIIKHDRIETPQGGLIIFMGMQDHTAESVKSLEGFSAWVEEAQTLSAKSLELLRPTIRNEGTQILFSWNPRLKTDAVDQFLRADETPPDSIVIQMNYCDNPFFPRELEAEREFDSRMKPDRYAHIWLGDYEPQAVGAIFMMKDIEEHRVKHRPNDIGRILVAVDPAISSAPGADEHGIIVGGVAEHGHGYVLEDATTRGTPERWAKRAAAMYDYYQADAVVIEKNQGGEMCKTTLHSIRPGLPVIEVVSTRGKHLRAEPISALYALGRVHHVGHHPTLEAQLCQMTAAGYEGDGSPDRVDALVHLMTHLLPDVANKPQVVHAMPQMIEDYDEYAC